MSRVVAVDYGKKRCGLAWTDELKLSINPQAHLPPAELLVLLKKMLKDSELDCLVLTESRHADGTFNDIQKDINSFANLLLKDYPLLKIEYVNEYKSSKKASAYLKKLGYGKKKRSSKGSLDSIAAGIILEQYLYDSGIW